MVDRVLIASQTASITKGYMRLGTGFCDAVNFHWVLLRRNKLGPSEPLNLRGYYPLF
jgi:hypothetical protein